MVGCAPCQPFSTHSQKIKTREEDDRWKLLNYFGSLAEQVRPAIVSMENVAGLAKQSVFKDFILKLEHAGYFVSYKVVQCEKYGIPQKRRRLVLLASQYGAIQLIPYTHTQENYVTVDDTISRLPPLNAGERDADDMIHCSATLSEKNMQRMQASRPGGSWRDWDKSLVNECHKKGSGETYASVYGRMKGNEPAPTMTTQFFRFGTGRFGHPTQNRAISLREGALFQTFPINYKFLSKEDDFSFARIGRHIGNAVPVQLGMVIGESIVKHIKEMG